MRRRGVEGDGVVEDFVRQKMRLLCRCSRISYAVTGDQAICGWCQCTESMQQLSHRVPFIAGMANTRDRSPRQKRMIWRRCVGGIVSRGWQKSMMRSRGTTRRLSQGSHSCQPHLHSNLVSSWCSYNALTGGTSYLAMQLAREQAYCLPLQW